MARKNTQKQVENDAGACVEDLIQEQGASAADGTVIQDFDAPTLSEDRRTAESDSGAEDSRATEDSRGEEVSDVYAEGEKASSDFAETENDTGSAKSGSGMKKGYVNYCLPFLPGKQPGDSHTVTVNGINYQIQYGEPVCVPVAVRDILEEMIAQSRHTARKIQELTGHERCIAKFK